LTIGAYVVPVLVGGLVGDDLLCFCFCCSLGGAAPLGLYPTMGGMAEVGQGKVQGNAVGGQCLGNAKQGRPALLTN